MKLALFDVDGTLLSCGGAGMLAMRRAAEGLFGGRLSFEGVSPAGSMDPILFKDALERAGAHDLAGEHDRFRDRYLAELEAALQERRSALRLMPGVRELLDDVRGNDERVVLGMLTGNYGPAASVKLRSLDLDIEWFRVTAFGDEADTRPGLVEVALERCEQLVGERLRGSDVLVIGDTPKDVGCAAAHGCTSLAVCTGRYGREELEACGATRVVDDLTDATAFWDLLS